MKTNTRILLLAVITASLSILGVARAQTVLWSENFDDGNGNNRWYADAGVWQIGTPTIGPETNSAGYRTHSGPYCATTGLTTDYPSSMNSRLVRIQTFTVPTAIQFPRLRFWHWYNFSGGDFALDYGVVEIKIGATGAWQEVSPHYTGFSGDWSYASIDLSGFAGQTVDVAFHAVSSGGSDQGWYVDDVAFETGTPVLNNPEGFEGGLDDWYAEQGTWQVGSPKKSGGAPTNSLGAQAYIGTNCAATLLNANYPAGWTSRLISPYFTLPSSSFSPYLRFWHWYSFSGGDFALDYGVVQIQVGTNAWQAISPEYTSTSGNYWTEPFIDLSSFGGQTVRLAFQEVSNGGSAAGWYVDDVQVYPYTLSALNPYLTITQSGTNNIITWTSLPDYSAFTLQCTNMLPRSPTNWNTVATAPVVINGDSTVTNPISGTSMFYRLIQ